MLNHEDGPFHLVTRDLPLISSKHSKWYRPSSPTPIDDAQLRDRA